MVSAISADITVENVKDGEMVYQRAVLLSGQCLSTSSKEDFLSIESMDPAGISSFPVQNWPISDGYFKSLIILTPGANNIKLQHYHNDKALGSITLTLTYIPLLQTPPLHLAILIAKDSPLIIDCPSNKRGAISSAHSDLDAAINKFRMTAYMWQALTADDLYRKGLGRRSFRLEEEWSADTLSREFFQAPKSSAEHMRSTAKVHLIRTDKTTAEIRDAQVAQQNPHAYRKDDLHRYFTAALKKHGGPFSSSAHPVVAGLILDSTFCPEQNLILGHAALGCSNPSGISLGIFGSHLTYSWPRFLEEVSSTLLDTAVPGDTVGNDNNECKTMWEACSIGQGAFLHEVGHAFGAPHTTGIMARGYAQDWPKNFLSRTAYCAKTGQSGATVVDGKINNDARWDISDALSFKLLPHFKLPSDLSMSLEVVAAEPNIQVVFEDDQEEFLKLIITSPAPIARVKFNGVAQTEPSVAIPLGKMQFTMDELEARFDRTKSLSLDVLGMNGKSRKIGNIWKLFSNLAFIRVPGSSIRLEKRSVLSNSLEAANDNTERRNTWDWSVLLNEKGASGSLKRATAIDSRVGCILDGAVVYYEDGHSTPCGPRWDVSGSRHSFGGHASEKFEIPEGVEITKVEVGRSYDLNGLRFHMSNGSAGGYLYPNNPFHTLEPGPNRKIVGFYGRSDWGVGFNGIHEFGIITAPRDVELPAIIYDMPELQNTDGGNGPRGESAANESYDYSGENSEEEDF